MSERMTNGIKETTPNRNKEKSMTPKLYETRCVRGTCRMDMEYVQGWMEIVGSIIWYGY